MNMISIVPFRLEFWHGKRLHSSFRLSSQFQNLMQMVTKFGTSLVAKVPILEYVKLTRILRLLLFVNTLAFLSSVSIVMCTVTERFWGMSYLGGFDVHLLFWRMFKQSSTAFSTVSFSTACLEPASIAPIVKDTNSTQKATKLLVINVCIHRFLLSQKYTYQT